MVFVCWEEYFGVCVVVFVEVFVYGGWFILILLCWVVGVGLLVWNVVGLDMLVYVFLNRMNW